MNICNVNKLSWNSVWTFTLQAARREQTRITSESFCRQFSRIGSSINESINHCHEIRSSDVSNAIVKMKSDKITDNGLVYSNNFIFGL